MNTNIRTQTTARLNEVVAGYNRETIRPLSPSLRYLLAIQRARNDGFNGLCDALVGIYRREFPAKAISP